jgi:putative transposase
MSQLNTELTAALLNNESLDEFFRSHLETAINDLLKNELTAFLGYEKHSAEGYNTGKVKSKFVCKLLLGTCGAKGCLASLS